MDLSRRALLAAAGTAATAGCLGTGSGGGQDGDATVRLRNHPDYGDILVDAAGMTLYLFERDTKGAGESACTGGCADAWPPLTVDGEPTAGSGVAAALTTFDRDDGGTQVAANGWPLYYFDADEEPGDVGGQGVQDVWWVLGAAGVKVTSEVGSGRSY